MGTKIFKTGYYTVLRAFSFNEENKHFDTSATLKLSCTQNKTYIIRI